MANFRMKNPFMSCEIKVLNNWYNLSITSSYRWNPSLMTSKFLNPFSWKLNVNKMNVLFFYILNLVEIAIVYGCECEVEPWSNWVPPDVNCGKAYDWRTRICSTNNGWTLGLTCSEEDKRTIYDHRDAKLPSCSKYFHYEWSM